MLTAAQMRAARALVGMEQKALAAASGVSLPTIQRMEASDGVVRGVIDSLMKVMAALDTATLALLAGGGILYSVGVVFHLWRRLPFHNAIWHGFVLVAAGIHYFAVLTVIPATASM